MVFVVMNTSSMPTHMKIIATQVFTVVITCHVIHIVINPPTNTHKIPPYPSTNVLLARMMACSHNTL